MSATVVYLLHFVKPYWHARHYLGYTANLERRIEEHRHGVGARLAQVCAEHGIGFVIARTWPGGRELERRLKRQKNSPKLCPLCAEAAAAQGVKSHDAG
jgi:predicted GIY-YIG superfamily endonuclease